MTRSHPPGRSVKIVEYFNSSSENLGRPHSLLSCLAIPACDQTGIAKLLVELLVREARRRSITETVCRTIHIGRLANCCSRGVINALCSNWGTIICIKISWLTYTWVFSKSSTGAKCESSSSKNKLIHFLSPFSQMGDVLCVVLMHLKWVTVGESSSHENVFLITHSCSQFFKNQIKIRK